MKKYIYIVEGECEKKLINAIKMKYIESGKIHVKNPLIKKLSLFFIRTIESDTTIIFVFDTDTNNIEILKENIQFIKARKNVKNVYLIPQISNLEEELLYSTSVKKIEDLTSSKSKKDFKGDFIKNANVLNLLEKNDFKIDKLWSRKANNIFKCFENNSKNIKKR